MINDLHRYFLGLDEPASPIDPVEGVSIRPGVCQFAARLLSLPLGTTGGPVLGTRYGKGIDVVYLLRGERPWQSHGTGGLRLDPAYVLGGIAALQQTEDPQVDWVGYWVTGDSGLLQQQAHHLRLIGKTRPLITLTRIADNLLIRAFNGSDGMEIPCQ